MVVSLEHDLDAALACEEDLPYNMTHRQNLLYWLNSIYGRAPTAPIVIVCTKADLVDDNTRGERVDAVQACVKSSVAISNVVGYREVSSKTGDGIDEVWQLLDILVSAT